MLLHRILHILIALGIPICQPRYHNRLPDVLSRSLQINQLNICDYCQCEKATMLCDFQKSKKPLPNIWNSAYFLPSDITAIQAMLTSDTIFELHDGFFHLKNRVNRIIIIGGGQVEITPYAFRNNQGGYPDVQILNVSNVFLKDHSFSGHEFKITIEDCQSLVIFPEAFFNVNASCNFIRIDHLEMNRKAFTTNSTVNLYIEDAQMNEIQSFEVHMNKINITNSRIGTILTKAFDVTSINELSFQNCEIKKIESGALTDRLYSNHVSITGCHIDTIDREAISGSGITELTLKNNTIHTIKSEALKVHSAVVFIQDNKINHSGKDWILVTDGQQIIVENNHFMDSGQVSLGHSKKPLNCSFANNRIDSDQTILLNITNCIVRAIRTDRSCNCNSSNVATSFDHDFSTEIYCALDERDQSCFNATNVNSRKYSNEACGSMLSNRTMRCTDGTIRIWSKDYGFITKEENAKMNRGMPAKEIILYIICAVFVLLIIVIIVYGICQCYAKSCEPNDKTAKCEFSQSELNTITTELGALKEDSPFRRNLDKLIKSSGKQTVTECKNRITHLISNTKDLPRGINICLERHLKSHNDNNILIESPHIGGNNRPAPSAPELHNDNGDEPIYEEPQQPLLATIYSEPHETGAVAPVYSEPVNAADANEMPPPYQAEYATPMRHHQLPQSSSIQQQIPPSSHTFNYNNNNTNNNNNAGYATPIWRPAASAVTPSLSMATTTTMPMTSPPITHAQRHVRDLRQDLEAKPQFHPNQLTSIRNQRQLHLISPVISTNAAATTSAPDPPVQTPAQGPATATIRHPQQRGIHLQRSNRNSFECLDGAASLAAMEHMDMRGAAGGCDTGSDHSGGSDETVKIDDVIEYADA